MNEILLSILIPSLDERKETCEKLVAFLKSQDTTNQVEILTYSDNRQIPTGLKRNVLIKRAKGKYICFVDDDDELPTDYISRLIPALEKNPDCTSLTGKIVFSDGYSREFIHSLKYRKWIDNHKEKIYYRPPNHLNCIRKEIAEKCLFPALYVGEDRVFSMAILPHLKSEEWIDGVLYVYKARKTFEEIHNGMPRTYEGVIE